MMEVSSPYPGATIANEIQSKKHSGLMSEKESNHVIVNIGTGQSD